MFFKTIHIVRKSIQLWKTWTWIVWDEKISRKLAGKFTNAEGISREKSKKTQLPVKMEQ